jgi:dihydrofolate reductase
MKVILYMATTVNGFIAKRDDTADFLTKEESASYVDMVLAAGTLIIGHRTYEILATQPEFKKFLEAGVKIIAVSSSEFALKDPSHKVAHSPAEALELTRGSKEVLVAGGGILNASFLEADLVDELYIDIEPSLLGRGIPLVNGNDFEKNLKLLGTKQFAENEIQLHYQVIK